jgi:Sulfotransferase family
MALPTFFIIGAPKAGTTSLHHYLDQHPEVQMSAVKEPQFFSGPADGIPYRMGRIEDLGRYEELFDSAVRVRGEATAEYAVSPRRAGVPERIKEMIPEAKFIYLVRNPVPRTVSNYKMMVALKGERRSLQEALGDFSDLRSLYISPSLYATQLELYLRQFPDDRILVLDQAELRAQRMPTLHRVFSFLDVDPEVESAGFEEELLTSQEWREYPDGYADFVAKRVAPLFRWIPSRVRRSARAGVERRLWPPVDTSMDDDLRERLEERFAPEVERLRQLTGQRFADWSV